MLEMYCLVQMLCIEGIIMVQTGSIGIDVKMKRLSVVLRQEENMMLMQMMRGKRVLKDLLRIVRMLLKLVIFMMMMKNLVHVVVI